MSYSFINEKGDRFMAFPDSKMDGLSFNGWGNLVELSFDNGWRPVFPYGEYRLTDVQSIYDLLPDTLLPASTIQEWSKTLHNVENLEPVFVSFLNWIDNSTTVEIRR